MGSWGSRDTEAGPLSFDGRYALFMSARADLVTGDTNEHVDVFRKDLQTGVVIRVSVGEIGQQSESGCGQPWISRGGRLIGFTSRDDALAPGDFADGYADVYLHSVPTGSTRLVTPGG